jgi:protein TonB
MPLIQRTNYVPKLTLPSAVDAPPDIHSTNAVIGLPDGLGNLSAGSGGQAGIGRGDGGLPGDGTGNHFGNGDGLYTPGQGVSMPVPVKTVEPEYSDEGRKARVSGSVLVYAEIDSTGHPRNLKVLRGIGVGLDEKALAAVAQWLFKPGTKGGKAVAVRATFVVNFRLL